MTQKLPVHVNNTDDFGLSEYEREIIDLVIWRKYRFSYVEAHHGPRERLLADAQQAVDPRLTERKMMTILRLPAAKRYARWVKENMQKAAMKRLKDVVPEVVDDYFWARQAARNAEDYKETRLAATDHLDRVGISEKPPTSVVQLATITLRSRNFQEADLLKESPLLEGEVVEEKRDDPADHPAQ